MLEYIKHADIVWGLNVQVLNVKSRSIYTADYVLPANPLTHTHVPVEIGLL
jgi:hypothetical protein